MAKVELRFFPNDIDKKSITTYGDMVILRVIDEDKITNIDETSFYYKTTQKLEITNTMPCDLIIDVDLLKDGTSFFMLAFAARVPAKSFIYIEKSVNISALHRFDKYSAYLYNGYYDCKNKD